MPGRTVVQWDKEDCAQMQIIKVDLLGLGMMAVLEDSIQACKESLWRDSRCGSVKTRPGMCTRCCSRRIRWGMFQVESRAPDGESAAQYAEEVLRPCRASGNYSARSYCRQDDAPIQCAGARKKKQ